MLLIPAVVGVAVFAMLLVGARFGGTYESRSRFVEAVEEAVADMYRM